MSRTLYAWLAVHAALCSTAVAVGQELVIDGAALRAAAATLDPFGELRATGRGGDGATRVLVIRFAELTPPAAGEHALGDDAALQILLDGAARRGVLEVTRWAREHATLHGELVAADAGTATTFRLDLPLAAAPATVTGSPPGVVEPAPADRPDPDDLVFCALGNTGTGDAGQRRVADAVAALAAQGPLDFALLLGDLVLPDGARDVGDPGFVRSFAEPYPEVALPVAFHAVLGDRDHRGSPEAYFRYAAQSARLRLPRHAYSFTVTCRGKRVLFVGFDSTLYGDGVRNPATRFVNRVVATALRDTAADVTVVFAHRSLHGSGPDGRAHRESELVRSYLGDAFASAGVDLYLSASPHHLELIGTEAGLVEVVSGTGGGLRRSVTAGPDTRFASTAPGFAWCRYDGTTMTVSLRDADGQVLHVHRWQPD